MFELACSVLTANRLRLFAGRVGGRVDGRLITKTTFSAKLVNLTARNLGRPR